MTPKKAMKLLHFTSLAGVGAETIKAAFAAFAKAAHPDTGGSGADIAQLKKARDTLLAEVEREAGLQECPRCGGSGRQKTRRGPSVNCSTCAGEGVIRKREFRRG